MLSTLSLLMSVTSRLRVACTCLLVFGAIGVARASEPESAAPKMATGLWMMAYWTPEIVFQNIFCQSEEFRSLPDKDVPLDRDAFGYVKSLKPGQQAASRMLFDFGPHYPAGDYVLLYDGRGELVLESATKSVNYKAIAPRESNPGRSVFTVIPDNGLRLVIKSMDPAEPIHNIRLLLPGCERTYATEVFAHDFIKRTRVLDFVRYQAVQNQWQNLAKPMLWQNRTTPQHQTQANRRDGWAIEYIVAAANALNNDLWYHIPDRADETYVREASRYLRANLKPQLKLYLEYANEVWNDHYAATQYMMELARKDGAQLMKSSWENADVVRAYYLRHAVRMMDIFEGEFRDHARIKRVCANWAGRFDQKGDEVLLKSGLVSKFDVYSVTSYFGGGLEQQPNFLQLSDAEVVKDVAARLEDSLKKVAKAAAFAREHRMEFIPYEGGFANGNGSNRTPEERRVRRRCLNIHQIPAMAAVYERYLDGLIEAGSSTAMIYAALCNAGWGYMEYEGQNSVQYQCVIDFIKRHHTRGSPYLQNP